MKELAFSVQDTPAQQLGATVLHLLGGLTGIGMGIFGKYIASLIQPNTPIARATPALFLSTIYSLAGWLDSFPKINLLHAENLLSQSDCLPLTLDVNTYIRPLILISTFRSRRVITLGLQQFPLARRS